MFQGGWVGRLVGKGIAPARMRNTLFLNKLADTKGLEDAREAYLRRPVSARRHNDFLGRKLCPIPELDPGSPRRGTRRVENNFADHRFRQDRNPVKRIPGIRDLATAIDAVLVQLPQAEVVARVHVFGGNGGDSQRPPRVLHVVGQRVGPVHGAGRGDVDGAAVAVLVRVLRLAEPVLGHLEVREHVIVVPSIIPNKVCPIVVIGGIAPEPAALSHQCQI